VNAEEIGKVRNAVLRNARHKFMLNTNPSMHNPTKVHPVGNRILIQFVEDPTSSIILPDNTTAGFRGFDVLEVGSEVKCCKAGDRVLLIASPNVIEVDAEKKIVLIDASVVVATVDK